MRSFACLFLLAACSYAAPPSVPWPNAGFEDGATGWRIGDTMSHVGTAQAAGGKQALEIVDTSTTNGSDVTSSRLPVKGGDTYVLRCRVFPVSGEGLGIYVHLLDAEGKLIGKGDDLQTGAPRQPVGKWLPFEFTVPTTPETRFVEVWLHSYAKAVVTAWLDEFELVPAVAVGPLWTPQYKLKPTDTARLTAADVVGPDGLVYPDWRHAGVPGGIPTVAAKVNAADCGAVPDDDRDDTAAIQAALDQATKAGGGAVVLGPGVYHLDGRLSIRGDHVVLRGAGRDRTRIVFRYALGPDGVRFAVPAGDTLYPNSEIRLHALPEGLNQLELFANDKKVGGADKHAHWGNTFSAGANVGNLFKGLPADATTVTLRGVAHYEGGATRTVTKVYKVDRQGQDPADYRRAPAEVAISFSGDARWWKSQRLNLAADGKRGDRSLTLADASSLKVGDWIAIEGPATERWKALTRNACQWGDYRRNILRITGVRGNVVDVSQPLRIEFPTIDGSRVYKVDLIEGCGLEDLTIEQTQNLWITAAQFTAAHGCWARGVRVIKCGHFPVYASQAKQCTITDCEFDDAWFKGGGGTAYAGWEGCFDCLMTNTTTRELRHAPLVQWAAAGNVIRNSTFIHSDMQWHSGWTNENLFENCRVDSVVGNGGYGYGAWASPPEDDAHGPNGPRNVVYHCDFSSPKTGLWMGGMNEGWMILYNRFQVGSGPGIFAKTFSFDHTLRGNAFTLTGNAPMVQLATPDCTGVEIYDNTYVGAGRAVQSPVPPAVDRNNKALPAGAAVALPTPPVPSIYEWEVANAK